MSNLALLLTFDPLTLLGTALLWLFPLLAWTRRPVTGMPRWVRAALPQAGDAAQVRDAVQAGNTAQAGEPPPPGRLIRRSGLAGGVVLACPALVMLGLHQIQPPPAQQGLGWALTYFSWLLFALIAGMVVTAAAVAGRSRRYRLVGALAAAGAGVLAVLAGHFLLAATDGCLPALSVLAGRCHWLPGTAWDSITGLVAPVALTLGVQVGAVAALVGAGAGALVRRWRWRAPASVPAPAVAGAAPLRGSTSALFMGRAGLAAACAVVLALALGLADGRRSPAPSTDRSAMRNLLAGPQRAPGPELSRQQVQAWRAVGGGRLMDAFVADADTLLGILKTLLRERPPTDAFTALHALCVDVARHTEEASEFLPVPDATAQPLWLQTQAYARHGSADCQQALQQGDSELLTASLTELTKAISTLEQAHDRLNQVAGPP